MRRRCRVGLILLARSRSRARVGGDRRQLRRPAADFRPGWRHSKAGRAQSAGVCRYIQPAECRYTGRPANRRRRRGRVCIVRHNVRVVPFTVGGEQSGSRVSIQRRSLVSIHIRVDGGDDADRLDRTQHCQGIEPIDQSGGRPMGLSQRSRGVCRVPEGSPFSSRPRFCLRRRRF